ncbi:MAG: PorV/PorQ family protein [bacterium]
MKKVFAFLILTGFCLAKTPGESGLAFLKLERDPLGFFENPASLVDKGRSAGFMYSMPLNEVKGLKQGLVNVSYSLKNGVIGGEVIYFGYGEMDEYNNSGRRTGRSWSAYDLCASLSYAREMFGLKLGGALKAISSKIDTAKGGAFALDLGAIANPCPGLEVGGSLKNLGTKIKYDNDKFSLPLSFNISSSYNIPLLAKIKGELSIPNDSDPYISLGIEKEFAKVLNLRLGYSTRKMAGSGILAGFGIEYLSYSFDYLFKPYGDLGDSHILSMGVRF